MLIALGMKTEERAKSIQRQKQNHIGNLKGHTVKLQSTAPLKQVAAENRDSSGDFKSYLNMLLEDKAQ